MTNETHPNRVYTAGFLLAGAYNVLGMLVFSKLFTNQALASIDPEVFSWLGQVAIVLWGLAYWSVAKSYRHVPALVGVFAIEKFLYSAAWLAWLLENGQTLPTIASDSLSTAVFFAVYGAGDFAFCIFFAWVALRTTRYRRGARLGQ